MGRAVFLPCGLFDLSIPALEPEGCWVGPDLSFKMAASRGAHTNEYSLVPLPPMSLSLQWATAAPTSPEDPIRQAGRSGLRFCEVMTFSLGPSGLPGSSACKESAYHAGDPGSIPGLGRSAGEGIGYPLQYSWAFLVAQTVKNLPAVWETWVQSLG